MVTKDIKAYVFSIGETTTELSKWSLERLGFTVVTLYDPDTTLAQKYAQFLEMAQDDEWAVRMDADVIVNKHFLKEVQMIVEFGGGDEAKDKDVWWWQFRTFCMLKQEVIDGTPMLMNGKVLKYGHKKYGKNFFLKESRPETAFFRDPQVNPHTQTRRMLNCQVAGIHGYRQSEKDFERVMKQKAERHQLGQWDLELTARINSL